MKDEMKTFLKSKLYAAPDLRITLWSINKGYLLGQKTYRATRVHILKYMAPKAASTSAYIDIM